jgi:hypothetical protein
MEQVLEEGKQFDAEMTQLAEEEVNPRMLDDEMEEGEEGEESANRKRASRSRSK